MITHLIRAFRRRLTKRVLKPLFGTQLLNNVSDVTQSSPRHMNLDMFPFCRWPTTSSPPHIKILTNNTWHYYECIPRLEVATQRVCHPLSIGYIMVYRSSHETLPLNSPQSLHMSNCYYHQDLFSSHFFRTRSHIMLRSKEDTTPYSRYHNKYSILPY